MTVCFFAFKILFSVSKVWVFLHNNKIPNKLHDKPYPNNFYLKSSILTGDPLCTNSIALKYSQNPEADYFACNFLLNYSYKNSLNSLFGTK